MAKNQVKNENREKIAADVNEGEISRDNEAAVDIDYENEYKNLEKQYAEAIKQMTALKKRYDRLSELFNLVLNAYLGK